MRNWLFYLLLCCTFIACKPNQQGESGTAETEVEPPIKQWISYEGEADKPNIVLVSGDEEYRSEEALPMLAKILHKHHGFNCTVLFAQDPEEPGILNPNYLNNIPGLEHLKDADMMVIFTRFRALPDDQMQHIEDYLKTGKPVLGIRTSTHAFRFDNADIESKFKHYGNFYEGDDDWKDGFGRLVLGEKWISHHGHHRHQSTRGIPAEGQENHPILSGIELGAIWGPTDVYGVRLPLPGDSQPIVLGQVVNRAAEYDEADPLYGMRFSDNEVAEANSAIKDAEKQYNPNEPMMPIAWTKSYQIPNGAKGKVFASTIGSSTDLLTEGTRRMIVNAVFWCLDMDVPEKANVDIVGAYHPTGYAFTEGAFWVEKDISIASLE